MTRHDQVTHRSFCRAALLALLSWASNTLAAGPAEGPRSASNGAVYYVSINGSDSNPGTQTQPWRTIRRAADTLMSGDIVYIKAGTYPELVEPRNSGCAGNYITYAAYPGDAVTIDGAGVEVPEWAGLFNVVGRTYIRISGLRIINARSNPHNPGILADTSSHIIIDNNFVDSTNDSGIGVWSSNDVTVDHNEVTRACLSTFNECISVGGTDGFVVKNNLVHNCIKEGICSKDGSRNGKVFGNEVYGTSRVGFYVDAWDKHTYNIDVFNNLAHDIPQGGFALASEQGGLLENVMVYNNVAYGNGWTGLALSTCCIATHPVSNIQIVNNTFYNNGFSPWGGGINYENPQAQGVTIRNNIASQNLTFQIAVNRDVPQGYYVVDHNLIDGFRGDPDEIRGDSYVEGDPKFTDAARGDFHLLQSSPAIGMASSQGAPPVDMEGYPRGIPPDIGAYEHRGSPAGVPGKATLVSPSGAIAATFPAYTWNAVPTATWYWLWVNDGGGSVRVQSWYTAAQASCATGIDTCSVTPAIQLSPGGYQWWVQTWNDSGYGPWSDGMTFTVGGGGPPGKASLISPKGTITTTTPGYTWSAVAGATWYYLWVNDSSSTAKIRNWYTATDAGCSCGTGTCSVTPSTALANGNGQWWIQTWNSNGYGHWSDAMHFTVAAEVNPPGKATLISPSGSVATNTPTYTWNAVAAATWYYLWVNDSSTTAKIQRWYTSADAGCPSGTGTCSVTPSTALASGDGQWWIQTWNSGGYGPWSDGMAFAVVGTGLSCPLQLAITYRTVGQVPDLHMRVNRSPAAHRVMCAGEIRARGPGRFYPRSSQHLHHLRYDKHAGQHFIAMEFLEGKRLRYRI